MRDFNLCFLCIVFISESNLIEEMSAIQIHSNKSMSVSKCTLNELQPPELTHILHQDSSRLNFRRTVELARSNVFECISSTNFTNSSLNTNRLLAIFSRSRFIVINYYNNFSIESKAKTTSIFAKKKIVFTFNMVHHF